MKFREITKKTDRFQGHTIRTKYALSKSPRIMINLTIIIMHFNFKVTKWRISNNGATKTSAKIEIQDCQWNFTVKGKN
jgi:hypothetical protein